MMEAEATSQLQKLGVLPTDDKSKYTWHKVIFLCCKLVGGHNKYMVLKADTDWCSLIA